MIVRPSPVSPLLIGEMPPHDQPRARLESLGPTALSDLELLQVLAQVDGPKAAYGVLASAILKAAGNDLRNLKRLSFDQLRNVPGLTRTRAGTVAAAVELGRRASATRGEGLALRSPRAVWAVFAAILEDLPHEEFHVAVLDSQHRMERDVLITRGILNSSLVHPREVFAKAIELRAAALVLVHNHPSGDPTPSADDRLVTDQLVAAGRLLDIPVHDHVIIGRGRYTSFAEAGLL